MTTKSKLVEIYSARANGFTGASASAISRSRSKLVSPVEKEVQTLRRQMTALRQENQTLKTRLQKLEGAGTSTARLLSPSASLHNTVRQLAAENTHLKAEIGALKGAATRSQPHSPGDGGKYDLLSAMASSPTHKKVSKPDVPTRCSPTQIGKENVGFLKEVLQTKEEELTTLRDEVYQLQHAVQELSRHQTNLPFPTSKHRAKSAVAASPASTQKTSSRLPQPLSSSPRKGSVPNSPKRTQRQLASKVLDDHGLSDTEETSLRQLQNLLRAHQVRKSFQLHTVNQEAFQSVEILQSILRSHTLRHKPDHVTALACWVPNVDIRNLKN